MRDVISSAQQHTQASSWHVGVSIKTSGTPKQASEKKSLCSLPIFVRGALWPCSCKRFYTIEQTLHRYDTVRKNLAKGSNLRSMRHAGERLAGVVLLVMYPTVYQ